VVAASNMHRHRPRRQSCMPLLRSGRRASTWPVVPGLAETLAGSQLACALSGDVRAATCCAAAAAALRPLCSSLCPMPMKPGCRRRRCGPGWQRRRRQRAAAAAQPRRHPPQLACCAECCGGRGGRLNGGRRRPALGGLPWGAAHAPHPRSHKLCVLTCLGVSSFSILIRCLGPAPCTTPQLLPWRQAADVASRTERMLLLCCTVLCSMVGMDTVSTLTPDTAGGSEALRRLAPNPTSSAAQPRQHTGDSPAGGDHSAGWAPAIVHYVMMVTDT
jgi:hypothetical protein